MALTPPLRPRGVEDRVGLEFYPGRGLLWCVTCALTFSSCESGLFIHKRWLGISCAGISLGMAGSRVPLSTYLRERKGLDASRVHSPLGRRG